MSDTPQARSFFTAPQDAYLDRQEEALGLRQPRSIAPKADASAGNPQAEIEAVSAETGVPVNVLLALPELDGADPQTAAGIVRDRAAKLAPHFAANPEIGISDAVTAATGDRRMGDMISDRALSIGRQLYPDQVPEAALRQPRHSTSAMGAIADMLPGNTAVEGGIEMGVSRVGDAFKALARAPRTIAAAIGGEKASDAWEKTVPGWLDVETQFDPGINLVFGDRERLQREYPTGSGEELVRRFKEGGITSPETLSSAISFVTQQGLASIPDMVAMVANFPAYVAARSVEIADEREEDGGTMSRQDVLIGAGTSVVSSYLDRLSLGRMLNLDDPMTNGLVRKAVDKSIRSAAKTVAKNTATETATEFTQEYLEAIAGIVSDDLSDLVASAQDPEAMKAGLLGALAGAGMGGAISTVEEGVRVRRARRGDPAGAQPPVDEVPPETPPEAAPVDETTPAVDTLPPDAPAAPVEEPPAPPPGPAPAPVAPEPEPPAGPFSEAMAQSPTRFPNLTQGEPVNVIDPDGFVTEAEFMGETAQGVKLMVGDQVFDYTDDMLAAGTVIEPRFRPDDGEWGMARDPLEVSDDIPFGDEPAPQEAPVGTVGTVGTPAEPNPAGEPKDQDAGTQAQDAKKVGTRPSTVPTFDTPAAPQTLPADDFEAEFGDGEPKGKPATYPREVTKTDGSPFSSSDTAWRALERRGLMGSDYEVHKVEGGYVARAKEGASDGAAADATTETAAPEAAPAPQEGGGGGAPVLGEESTQQPGGRLEDEARGVAGDAPAAAVERPPHFAKAMTDAQAAGEVSHTTRKGKTLTGYILKGLTKDEASEIDEYTFRKNGGWFARTKNFPAAPRVEQAAAQAETAPTEAQKEAENYRKGHVRLNGLDITIENAKGSERSGTDAGGKPWSVTMPAHYGYVKRTEGADGDQVDVYIGEKPESDKVFVVDQMDAETGAFDEHKVMLGFDSAAAAEVAYLGGFSDGKGRKRLGAMTHMSMAEFKEALKDKAKWKAGPLGRVNAATPARAVDPADVSLLDPLKAVGFTQDKSSRAVVVARQQQESGTQYTWRVFLNSDGFRAVRFTAFPQSPGVTAPPDKQLGTFPSADAALAAIRKDGFKDTEELKQATGDSAAVEQTGAKAAEEPPAPATPVRKKDGVDTAPAQPPAPAPKSTPKTDEPMADYTGVIINGYDDQTSEDGRNSAIKNGFKSDATRFARNVAARLKALGFEDPTDRKGKKARPVRWNAAGPASSGEVYMEMVAPNGLTVLTTIQQSAMTGRRGGLTVMVQIKNGSRFVGPNEYPNAGISPSNMASFIEERVSRAGNHLAARKAAEASKATEVHEPPQSPKTASPAGPRIIINVVGKDGLTDAERGGPYQEPKAEPTAAPDRGNGPGNPPDSADNPVSMMDDLTGNARRSVVNGVEYRLAPDTSGKGWRVIVSRYRPWNVSHLASKTETPWTADEARAAAVYKAFPQPKAAPEPAQGDQSETPEPTDTLPVEQAPESDVNPGKKTNGVAKEPSAGILGALSQEKQDRAAELKRRLAAKAKGQLSSGIDPEYITLGGELVALYIEAGTRRFAQMLRDFAETTGLTMREAQAPMRAAYNFVREEKELAGEDVSDMDSADAVMAEVKKALADEKAAETVEKPAESGNIENKPQENGDADLGLVQGGEQEALGDGADGQQTGTRPDRVVGDARTETGGRNEGDGLDQGDGARPRGQDARGADAPPQRGKAADRRPRAGRTELADEGAGGRGSVGPDPRENFVINDPAAVMGGGPVARFNRNKAAIEALNDITAEGREPTPDEIEAMAGYTGWGSFGQELFQGSWDRGRPKEGWEDRNAWLRDHLGESAWKSAQASILNAHYTDPPTVQAMWAMVEKMGFKGGRVLEPSMGIGNFYGLMPQHLAKASTLTGIELDKTTGGMAALLYPRANVQIKGYETSRTPDDFYDLVIGNWPFAARGPADRRYNDLSPSLHDYFFVKALDQVRPGGLVVGITSAGTMDKQGTAVRKHLARKAELVASYRLPTGAFEGYAGTKVVTDIIILKKREAPLMAAEGEGWIESREMDTPAGRQIRVNEYYHAHPENVLGTLNFGSGTTYGRAAMIVDRPADYAGQLAALPERVPAGAFAPITRGKEARFTTNSNDDRVGSIVDKDGELWVAQGDQMAALADMASYQVKSKAETARREQEIRDIVALRRAYGATIDAERDGKADTEKRRAALKKSYDAFVKAYGPVKESFGLKTMLKVGDPAAPMLSALERPDGTPSAILTEPLVRAQSRLANPTVTQAFVQARNESRTLDLDRVAELSKSPRAEVEKELLEDRAIYRLPGGQFDVADAVLSGNVRRRLAELLEAKAGGDETLEGTIEAVRKVVPEDIPYHKIEANLGAAWIPPETFVAFAKDILNLTDAQAETITVLFRRGSWVVKFGDRAINHKPEATAQHGAAGVDFHRILRSAMNNESIKLFAKDEEGKKHFDEEASKLANAKVGALRDLFRSWVWSDPARRVETARTYNDVMNAMANPSFDGSFLDFPGMALHRGDQPFNLRSHQVNAIWRGLLKGRGIYAHEVGTGKTYTMAGLAVESRRYGLSRKPMIVAHNANSATVAKEINDMYPGAKVLYIDNLSPDTIKTKLYSIRNDDWDAVVIPHSLIDRLTLSAKTLTAMTEDEIAAMEDAALEAAAEDGVSLSREDMDDEKAMSKLRSVTAKELVKARNTIIERMNANIQKATREDAVTFEDLGIDMLLVDEVHEFKKPPFATKMQMKGLNKSPSARSVQLQFLTRYIAKINGGRGNHIFTGTPITNTLGEMFHMMRYAMEDTMADANVDEWDSWFNTFADAETDIEIASDGQFEMVTRLSSFVNVADLRRLAADVLDVVFADDMPEFAPRKTATGKILSDTLTAEEEAELRNGRTEDPIGRPYKKIVNDTAEMTPPQRAVQEDLARRYNAFRKADRKTRYGIIRKKGGDERNPLIIEGEAAAAALDIRLRNPSFEDHPQSKVNRMLRNVMAHYREHPRASQVIFMDKGYDDHGMQGGKKVQRLNISKDIKAKLMAEGVPAREIAIVTGSTSKMKRKEIAQKVASGEIRIVMGGTQTLGVGVNMQDNLRAMHHLDAPWMPGELEQRNGRGQRQGNKWNTVFEYRYMVERLDAKRWQILAKKMQFIRSFMKASLDARYIEGSVTDMAEGESVDDIMDSLSEAAGDPRIMQRAQLSVRVSKLKDRASMHRHGADTAEVEAGRLVRRIERDTATEKKIDADARHVAALKESGAFSATIDGKTYDKRAEAIEALDTYMDAWKLPPEAMRQAVSVGVEVNGFRLLAKEEWRGTKYLIDRESQYQIGKASVAAIEANIRTVPRELQAIRDEIATAKESRERMLKAAKEPFPMAEELAQKEAQLKAIEEDLAANPIPAPAWLRQGAVIDTTIMVDGEPQTVIGHKWGDDDYYILTDKGEVPYLDARDEDGGRLFDEHEWTPSPNAAERNNEPRQMRREVPPVVRLTGDELGANASFLDLRGEAKRWYRENLIGATATTQLGWKVAFNRRGMNKATSKGDALLKAIPAIKSIIERGTLILSEPSDRPGFRWHHVIAAPVEIASKPMNLVVTVREHDNGLFHYDLAWDSGERGPEFTGGGQKALSRWNYPSPDLNIGVLNGPINRAPAGKADRASVVAALTARLKEVGLDDTVTLEVANRLLGKTADGKTIELDGQQRGALIQIALDAADGVGVLNHEIVHLLRSQTLWGRPYGLFTQSEWRSLVRFARQQKRALARAEKAYADEAESVQIEEAIAELYRQWAAGERPAALAPVAGLFRKVQDALRAIGKALIGLDLVTPQEVFQAIESGEVAARAPRGASGRVIAANYVPEGRAVTDARVMSKRGRTFIRAWHGSPHDFERFSIDKIGTGEGAQAYGHGLYFAESEAVARSYRDTLANMNRVSPLSMDYFDANGNPVPWHEMTREQVRAAAIIQDAGGTGDVGLIDQVIEHSFNERALDKIKREVRDFISSGITARQPGRLYEVEIDADPDDFLDLSAPFSEWPERHLSALKGMFSDHMDDVEEWFPDLMEGGDLGDVLHNFDEISSEDFNRGLQDRGIRGIKYWDGMSRGRPGATGTDSTRNYVVFDDSLITITGKQKRRDPDGEARQMRRPSADGKEAEIARRAIDHALTPARNAAGATAYAGRSIASAIPRIYSREGRADVLTDAMVGSQDGKFSLLALVPGYPLLSELAKNLPGARVYQRAKDEMDALRNEWHARTDETAQAWNRLKIGNRAANERMMDIMHRATLMRVNPDAAGFNSYLTQWDRDMLARGVGNKDVQDYLDRKVAEDKKRRDDHRALRAEFETLPAEFKEMYRRVKKDYTAAADAFEKAVLENVTRSIEHSVKRAKDTYAKDVQTIRDDGLQGDEKDEAMEKARKKRDATIGRLEASATTRVAAMRAKFESQRIKGPYFPLARWGSYYVTLRDEDGKILSFSRFESRKAQREFMEGEDAREAATVEHGVIDNAKPLSKQIDPKFMADLEGILGEWQASDQLMDEVWQRYLSTLPDASIRTRRIHRKGTPGFSQDALRAYADHQFHAAHQLARLKYGLDLEDALVAMRKQAKIAANPERAAAVVNEISHRHAFTMNPTGGPVAQGLTQLGFIWYLGVTPAAAAVNLTQTTIVGPGVMASRFKAAGTTGAVAELGRALKDFTRGRGSVENKRAGLTAKELAAMEEAYRRGTIDKTQGHDLAGIAESGTDYSATRQWVMGKISWFFHNSEKMNREITFLAAYRLGRKEGMSHEDAIEAADQTTYKIHFDYQNCVDDETECLTTRGWKRHDQLEIGDRVISVDDMGRAIEVGLEAVNVFPKYQNINVFRAKGKGRRFSMAVTDEHTCVIHRQKKIDGVRHWDRVEEIKAKDLKPSHHVLRAPVAPIEGRDGVYGVDMAALIGWIAAEGNYAKNRGAKAARNVRLEQSQTRNPAYVEEIDGILERIGLPYSRHKVKEGRHVLWSLNRELSAAIMAHMPEKRLTWKMVATMTAEEMAACLDAFAKGDGHKRAETGTWTISQKMSTNRGNLEVLQAMATMIGRTASIGDGTARDLSWLILGGTGRIKGTRTQVCDMDRYTKPVDRVWCPTTENGRWVARRHGCVFVTGNTSRPRVMQSDTAKVLLLFRNFQVNMLYRFARDLHQATSGASAEARAEARAQATGIAASMFLHAGLRGVIGYSLITGIIGLFFEGGDDDVERHLQRLLAGTDSESVAGMIRQNIAGMVLNGTPGHLLGIDLVNRIGMPDLWFRGTDRMIDEREQYAAVMMELLGPLASLGQGIWLGGNAMLNGDLERGLEQAVPKFARDVMKSGRYLAEGVTTWKGDPILDEVSIKEALTQSLGFTPARVSERYATNTRMKNREQRIMDTRSSIQREAGDAVLKGRSIPASVIEDIRQFNGEYPEYPITAATLKQSVGGRARASARNESGIQLNPKLNDRIRGGEARSIVLW